MSAEHIYVGKCVDMGIPRVWGKTKDDCKLAMQDYTNKHIRNLRLTMTKYPHCWKTGLTDFSKELD